jgi:uncharacterized protein DUF742
MIDGANGPGPDEYSSLRRDADPWRARPFTVTNGRTKPSIVLDLMSLVKVSNDAAMSADRLGIDHAPVFDLCRSTITIAEVAAHLGLPITVAKILTADLIESGVLVTRAPTTASNADVALLEAVRDGLRAL